MAAIMNKLAMLSEKFANILKPHDREDFQSTTFQGMKRELHNIQTLQDGTGTLMNMKRIEKFLSGMEKLDKALAKFGTVEAEQPMAMAYVWGSIRYLLKHTMPFHKAFDGVLDVYEQIGVNLPSLSDYEDLFRDFPDSGECLVNIYQDVQQFHSVAYELFSLRPKLWQRLHKSTWKDLNHTFKQLSKSLDAHRTFLQSYGAGFRGSYPGSDASHSQGLTDWNHISDDFSRYCLNFKTSWNEFKDKETARKRKQRSKVKTWVSSSSKVEEMHKKFQNLRICPNSGRWLFRSYGKVSDWMKEDEPPESALWIHGSRGFGKTILSSLVVDELKALGTPIRKYVIPAESKIYYFYCQEDDNEHRTHLDILKGVLHQMVDSNDYILPLCEDQIAQSGGDSLTNGETAQALMEAFIEHNSRQYIIIDGLNECEITEARQTAEFFNKQVNRCDNEFKLGQLRVLFMGQPMLELSKHLPADDASIALKHTDNADDIRDYVRARMPEFSGRDGLRCGFNLSETQKQQMETMICRQNMFLHAHLTIEYLLQQQTKQDLLERITQEMMPDELSAIYEKLLGSVKANLDRLQGYWEKATLLLGWLVCAKRPLRWHEIQSILSFDPEKKEVDFDNRMLRHHVQKYLGSLVHVLDGGHIRLVHSTARRYIIHNKYIDEKKVQCKLTTLCLNYLSLDCFVSGCEDRWRRDIARLGWFSFQDYACSYWHSHIDTVVRECNEIDDGPVLDGLATALELFINRHGRDLTDTVHPELEVCHIAKFQFYSLYQNLYIVWNHIFTHQKSDFDMRNTVGIIQIDNALLSNRISLEECSPSERTVHEDTMEDYYGPNLFKCRRTLCRFFHLGYDNQKARDKHHDRHNRPYTCPKACNSAPIGFSTKKDKERHVRVYHPELVDGPSMFATPRHGQRGRFNCLICASSFTRKINLKGHERSHFGDRPFACSTCGKAFTRSHDCRRHEKIHARRGA